MPIDKYKGSSCFTYGDKLFTLFNIIKNNVLAFWIENKFFQLIFFTFSRNPINKICFVRNRNNNIFTILHIYV